MGDFGLNKDEVANKLKLKGITDEALVNAIAEIFEENNKAIKKQVTETVSGNLMDSLRAKGIRKSTHCGAFSFGIREGIVAIGGGCHYIMSK